MRRASLRLVAAATLFVALGCDGDQPGEESGDLRAALRHQDAINFTDAAIGHMAAGNYEQAQITAARAVQADNTHAPAHHALAWASLHTGDRHLQLVSGLEAVRLAPDSAAFRRTLGVIFETTGRLNDAESEFRQAVRLNPADTVAWLDLARLAHRRRRFPLADSAFGMVDSLMPGHFDSADADAQRWTEARVQNGGL